LLSASYVRSQVREARALLADLDGQLEEAKTIAPLALARLVLGVNDVIEHLERILAEVDEATAPVGETDGGIP